MADRFDELQRGIEPAAAELGVYEIQAVINGTVAFKAEIGRDSRLLGRLLKNAAGGYRLELDSVLRVVYHFKYRVGKIRGAQPVHNDIADADGREQHGKPRTAEQIAQRFYVYIHTSGSFP